MQYTYTYRDSDGATRQAEINADSRSEVFARLKDLGVSPLSVREGRMPGARKGQGVKWMRGAIAGALVAVAALIAIMFVPRSGAPTAKQPEKNGTQKPPRRTVQAKTQAPQPEPTNTVPTTIVEHSEGASSTNSGDVVSEVIATNRPGVRQVKGTFKTGTEQILSLIFTCPLGNPPPPLPKIGRIDKDRMWQILTSPNIVDEADSEKAADAKRTVELAKKELRDYLLKGGDFDEFLAYYRGQLVQAHHQWQDSQRVVIQACRDEDPEVARAMLDEVNKRLEKKGIKQIMLPPVFRKKLGIDQ